MQESGCRMQIARIFHARGLCRGCVKDAGRRNCQGVSESGIQNPESFQSGFSLISAIFLLVVIALLSTFAVTLSSTQNQSQAMDLMKARGYQAALAGVEWAAYNVNQQAENSPAAWDGCATGAHVVVGGNLAPFSPVTVNCTAVSYVEGTTMRWVYTVEAVARTAGSAGDENYVEQTSAVKLVK